MSRSYMIAALLLGTAGAAGAQTVGCSRYTASSGATYRVRPAFVPGAFSGMQVDSLLNGITLTNDQRKRAVDIVENTRVIKAAPSTLSVVAHLTDPSMDERNAKLAALLATDADKARLADNISEMKRSPFRCDVPMAG